MISTALKILKGNPSWEVDETSLGGWRVAWREFKEKGVDPYRDFAALKFGRTHDDVVYAVRDGIVDAGTVRTDIIERMTQDGKIEMSRLHVINLKKYRTLSLCR